MATPSQSFIAALPPQKIEVLDGDTATQYDPRHSVLIFSGPIPPGLNLSQATYLELSSGKVQAFVPEIQQWLLNLYGIWLESEQNASEFKHYFDFWETYRKARAPATVVLVACCVVLYLVTSAYGGNSDLMVLARFGAANPLLIRAGEWWRLVGASFLHVGIVHILVNMYALWNLGRGIERFYGTVPFLGLYALAAVTGSLADFYTSADNVLSAGASGAIFGLFGAAGVLSFKHELPKRVAQGMRKDALTNLVLNLGVAFTVPNLGHAAHLGGLVAGALFAAVVPIASRQQPRWLVGALGLMAVAYFAVELVTLYHAFQ